MLQDLRYALRTLMKSPGFTAVAVIALALGIGANTVNFSSINAMLLHPFPFKDLDRAVDVWETVPQQNQQQVSVTPANFRDWKDENNSIDLLTAFHGWNVNLTGTDIAERVEGYQVTANFFPLLGIAPQLGRSIAADNFEAGHTFVVVLSHGFWQRHLGADPAIVGKNVLLNGQQFTVIGIMPADFDFPVGAEAWAPLDLSVSQQADRADHYLRVLGRLKTGATSSTAQADLETIASRLSQQYPQTNAGHGVRVIGLLDDITFGSKQFVLVLMGAAGFVLLLACANVANLLLARSTGRQKEIAVRIALGASRWQIAHQLLAESILLGVIGGLAGLLLAVWGLDLTHGSIPPFIVQHVAGLKHLQIDSRVLGFTLAVALLTGVLAGLAPALHVSRPDLNDVLKEGARGGTSSPARRRLRALLVVSEVSLALILLVGAGLMVKGFRNLANTELGFDRQHLLTFRIALSEKNYDDPNRVRGFYDQAVQKLEGLPGVESVAVVTSLPGGWSGWNQTQYTAEGQPSLAPGEMRTTLEQSVTPDFFRALRVPLVKGRFISAQDGSDAPPTLVISESLALRIWPDQDPIGKRMRFGPDPQEGKAPWRTVIGVVGDIKQSPWDREPNATTYFPFDQYPQASSALVVRTTGNPLALAAAARAQVLSLDPDQPPYDTRTLEQVISDDVSGVDFSARMMLVFGGIALVLAAAGIFAVMAYSVLQRTHEIGVRMALGAERPDVIRLVVGYALKLAAVGLAIGIPCALAITHALSSVLFGIIRIDPLTFVSFTVLLVVVAAVAAYIPARWAARVDPVVALHHE
ncbi:MAG TPA: ABC transporter permease [Terriglobia bacterium]|nr:ABC transporter permease [Terriglobia bacterium]